MCSSSFVYPYAVIQAISIWIITYQSYDAYFCEFHHLIIICVKDMPSVIFNYLPPMYLPLISAFLWTKILFFLSLQKVNVSQNIVVDLGLWILISLVCALSLSWSSCQEYIYSSTKVHIRKEIQGEFRKSVGKEVLEEFNWQHSYIVYFSFLSFLIEYCR